ncbi:MAG: alpha/beta hydrolase [Pedobacter agri]|jgi:pimeloyl-ACP methyl ester carboxylesterase|uniref:Alpha/beta hydrolase n=1 Tax=Pedobacter agri TaxID=454586 RepID=A0A9X3DFH5_9SPHI|nr:MULTISPECIES: alpha/beta hydrolase [Pedobacter]AZI23866.1 alpha/beta hydrolase [Pedobacter sp. G11]MCX3266195.1 alpha/beta hydrolase [Pedobacter agri]MDQ1139860.1 pimeloyl-ACP methyl ester carboxylesterase [Pedobacter agri]
MTYEIIEEDGFKYIEAGKGQTLVLLHGLMGELSNWELVIEQFKDRYHVVIPILPIYELPILTLGVKALSRYLHRFLKFKKLNQVVLVGNSLGGHVGLVFTVAHQEFVKALVLTGSSGLYENAFGGSFPRRESYDYIKEKVEFTFYDPATATKALVDDVFKTVNDRSRVIRILTMAKSAIRHNMAKELSKITIPVSLIWGKNDKVTPPEVAEEFHQLLPNSELNWVDQCGHAPMMEHPEIFNAYLEKFLDRILLK